MDKRYIKYFDGYRAAYGLADFDDPKAFVEPESGKKKPVYRWNYEPLTEKFMRLILRVIYLLVFNPVMKIKK